nr:putative serine/threonine protein kinase [uncultured bacterium]
MGAVYKGYHLRLRTDVAVKIMKPPPGIQPSEAEERLERFWREAGIAASVRHQNLINVLDINEENGINYIIMDYIDGGSLRDLIDREGKLSESEATRICYEVAQGLGYAHRKGVVHRDIKPENILMDSEDRVIVADLGLAKPLERGHTITRYGEQLATWKYAAPEQWDPDGEIGPQADVWMLAATLYEMLDGHLPDPSTALSYILPSGDTQISHQAF